MMMMIMIVLKNYDSHLGVFTEAPCQNYCDAKAVNESIKSI